jgi:hypothetical protein
VAVQQQPTTSRKEKTNMSARIRIPVVLAGLLTMALGAGPMSVSAQTRPERPVFLALPRDFPDLNARVVLLREPGRDIVILDEDDSGPETLRVALLVLRRLSREGPPQADRGQLVPITGFAGGAAIAEDERRALESTLAELRERPLANVGNLGPGRWMQYLGS